MDWLSKSPAMNPIEHLLGQMVVHIPDMDNLPTTEAQLRVALQKAWVAMRPVRTLVRVMLCRMHAVLTARGGHTHV